jgi:SSS family solute:Na+ symporter
MHLSTLDWSFIVIYFAISLWIGLRGAGKSGSSASEYFLSGRNMPWWLLGVSMVATTFSCDTPNLVTDIVRQNGVAGNWAWWAFLLTGMLTVFVYARLWRRSGVMTDLEFYEMRYSGKEAALLRGFRAVYLGVFFNVMIMATVSLAAIKIGQVMFNVSPVTTLVFSAVLTVAYSTVGGFRSVLLTDFFQFIIAMIGSFGAAYVVLQMPQVGGLDGLFSHPNVAGKLSMLPDFSDTKTLIPLLIIPLAVQWWSTWYPGAEPGGGGSCRPAHARRQRRTKTPSAPCLLLQRRPLRPAPLALDHRRPRFARRLSRPSPPFKHAFPAAAADRDWAGR